MYFAFPCFFVPVRLKCEVSLLDSGKNNPMLVSGSDDRTIKIWDLKTYQEIRTLDVQCAVTCIAVSDDKKYIISADIGGSVRLQCFHTGKCLSCYEGHTRYIRWVHSMWYDSYDI